MKLKGIISLFIVLFGVGPWLFGQYNVEFVASLEEDMDYALPTLDSIEVRDTLGAFQVAKKEIQKLHAKSYFEAYIKEWSVVDSSFIFEIHQGKLYTILEIQEGNVPKNYFQANRIRLPSFDEKVFEKDKILNVLERIIQTAENTGYPFAQVRLIPLELNSSNQLTAKLDFQKNQFIEFDSITLEGNTSISKRYLENYLGLKSGDPYSASKISQVETKLQEIPFIRSTRRPSVRFIGSQALLNLEIGDKNASRFDLIIGVLPNNQSENNLQISGDISMDMYNKLKRGEHIFLQFQRLKPETQSLDASFSYPFILNLPFGIDTQFDLFRNENTTIDVSYDIGVQYFFNRLNQLKFYWSSSSSRLLEIDTSQIIAQSKLPNTLDVRTNSVGIQLDYNNLDYILNPRKGFLTQLSVVAGIKTILPNNQITSLRSDEYDFSAAYDSLDLSSNLYTLKSDLQYFIPVQQLFTIQLRNRSAIKFGNTTVFRNEFFRLGGNKVLRGFDEQSIWGNFYSISGVEARMLLSTNSYLFVFGELAWVRNPYEQDFEINQPMSFGAGLNFETNAGIFGISLAIGKEKDNPFDFRNAKTHFGFVSLF